MKASDPCALELFICFSRPEIFELGSGFIVALVAFALGASFDWIRRKNQERTQKRLLKTRLMALLAAVEEVEEFRKGFDPNEPDAESKIALDVPEIWRTAHEARSVLTWVIRGNAFSDAKAITEIITLDELFDTVEDAFDQGHYSPQSPKHGLLQFTNIASSCSLQIKRAIRVL